MGSPEDEEGRLEAERRRQEKTFDRGFWVFDAPCTQVLWEAVMGAGTNPSAFPGADRPVECVCWNDCQGFLRWLNERLAGLDLELGLLSEAQWEYACRAGTASARYHEDLDAIAWYGGNSGGETHAVRGKRANGWGLYDMLGNVWEWCADPWTGEYHPADARVAAGAASSPRILRGGSWGSVSRHVRAAYRDAHEPTYRHRNLGFRCAEFRSES
jgi:formylglycine-generating enzyme required for sulfatase activity